MPHADVRWIQARGLALGLGLVAAGIHCGGIAVVDPAGEGGAGGNGGVGGAVASTSTTTPGVTVTTTAATHATTTSTSSGPQTCQGFQACCEDLCTLLSSGMCPIDDCDCDTPPGPAACEEALADWYRCLVDEYPDSIACAGGPMPACGICDPEAAAVQTHCGFEFPCF